MIIEGDGSFQKRLDAGRCPRCDCETLKKHEFGKVKCSVCKLLIDGRSAAILGPPEEPDEDTEGADTYDQRYAQCDNL